jgi:MFS family permease
MPRLPDLIRLDRAKVQFGLVFLAHALGALSVLSVLTAGPRIAADLGLTVLQVGGLASVYSAALALASLPAGLVTDRPNGQARLRRAQQAGMTRNASAFPEGRLQYRI